MPLNQVAACKPECVRADECFSRELVRAAVRDSFPKLDPRKQLKNPVMFIVELGSVITTGIFILELVRGQTGQLWFVAVIAFWLWLTVLFVSARSTSPRSPASRRR